MKNSSLLSIFLFSSFLSLSQDLSEGLLVNDLALHPMQEKSKPAYLDTIIDPSFGTTIRRISDAGVGGVIVPMYSTIQAWNSDESLMIIYDSSLNTHRLLNGTDYNFIRLLDDVSPDDIEQLFWHFDNPDILFYLESGSDDFIRYNVQTEVQEVLVNLDDITTNCEGSISMGNDVQMMSWDSDVIGFRCNNDASYSYRISTGTLVQFDMDDVSYIAAMPGPSGTRFYHDTDVYDSSGSLIYTLNEASAEHGCLGELANGHDGHFAVAFVDGPDGTCGGNIVAHDMETGDCFSIVSEEQGYDYSQSGTHISALSHKNTQGGWLTASMIGYDEDGQELLDQELIIARADADGPIVCRIGHHRSDENDFDYWGEPHAVISPTGTRVLFASDWSGVEDGQSIDCYVVELPVHLAQGACIGDFNADNVVDIADFLLLNSVFGSACIDCPEDIDANGTVDIDDFLIFNSYFNEDCE